jgi:hypothetical protein
MAEVRGCATFEFHDDDGRSRSGLKVHRSDTAERAMDFKRLGPVLFGDLTQPATKAIA